MELAQKVETELPGAQRCLIVEAGGSFFLPIKKVSPRLGLAARGVVA